MTANKVRMVPFALIDCTRVSNPRTDLGNIEELVHSFRHNGQLVPIIVQHEHAGGRGICEEKAAKLPERPKGKIFDIYPLVAGQRRMAAMKILRDEAREAQEKLGRKTSALPFDEVMAVIRVGNEVDLRVDQLIENLHRKDMNPLETAEAIKELDNLGYPMPDIAKRLDRSDVWCRQLLNLRERGSLDLHRAIVRDHLPLTVAFSIAKKPEDEQKKLLAEYKTTLQQTGDGSGGREAKRAAKRKVDEKSGQPVRMAMPVLRRHLARLSPSKGATNFDDPYLNGLRDGWNAVLGVSNIAVVNLDKLLPSASETKKTSAE